MNPASEERHLGEYRLQELLSENPVTRTWLAEQISVSRKVLVDELRAKRVEEREAFLADVRVKASVDHPLIGSVYEAVDGTGKLFLRARTPARRHSRRAGESAASVPPGPARAHPAAGRRGAASARGAPSLHLADGSEYGPSGRARCHPPQEPRHRRIPRSGPVIRDIAISENALAPLVAEGQPGATRMLTLFGWMRGEGLDAPITWAQTRDFCMQIEHQLADSLSILTPTREGSFSPRKHSIGPHRRGHRGGAVGNSRHRLQNAAAGPPAADPREPAGARHRGRRQSPDARRRGGNAARLPHFRQRGHHRPILRISRNSRHGPRTNVTAPSTSLTNLRKKPRTSQPTGPLYSPPRRPADSGRTNRSRSTHRWSASTGGTPPPTPSGKKPACRPRRNGSPHSV